MWLDCRALACCMCLCMTLGVIHHAMKKKVKLCSLKPELIAQIFPPALSSSSFIQQLLATRQPGHQSLEFHCSVINS